MLASLAIALGTACSLGLSPGADGARAWYPDGDGDGWGVEEGAVVAEAAPAGYADRAGDCDDADPDVHPEGAEACNGVDDDCDGLVDDEDPGLVAEVAWPDLDGDGWGAGTGRATCSPPAGWTRAGGDCDDADPDVHPGADERCDGVDDDCDGTVDEADALDARTFWPDADGDGWGDEAGALSACAPPGDAGFVEVGGDCDDADPSVHPGGIEVCNGVDDDCDGLVDDEDPSVQPDATWYADADGDGWGDEAEAVAACDAPPGFVADAGDCDDGDPEVRPFAGDALGDGVDDDCDGLDCEADGIGDAYFVVCLDDVNWHDADWICQDAGYLGLASIRDESEQAFLEALLQDAGGWESDAPWIGYTDAAEEGVWEWTDGWKGGFEYWKANEPNDQDGEDCAHFNWNLQRGTWNDAGCELVRGWSSFACEAR